MRTLEEAEVKDILRHKEEKVENIHTKVLGLYQELNSDLAQDILSAAAMTSPALSGLPGALGGNHKDLGDILEKYHNMRCQRNIAVRMMMGELVEEEERISRVWACFYALDNPYFALLKALYVENQLYEAVEKEFGAAHKTFEKYRREGIQLIIRCFESDKSIAELMHFRDGIERMRKKTAVQRKNGRDYIQFNLTDYIHPSHGGKDEAELRNDSETGEKEYTGK